MPRDWATLYASVCQMCLDFLLGEVTRNLKTGFGGAFVFTLKFDAAGNWKIANTQRISGKEAEKYESDDEK